MLQTDILLDACLVVMQLLYLATLNSQLQVISGPLFLSVSETFLIAMFVHVPFLALKCSIFWPLSVIFDGGLKYAL